MEDERLIHGPSRGLWKYFYPAFFCAACLPQLLSAASLNQDGNCTITDKNNPGYQADCQDTNKYDGSRDTIIVAEDEVINVFASDSNKTVIAINGGRHRDTIINYGEIYLQVTNTGEPLPLFYYNNYNHSLYAESGHKDSDKKPPSTRKPAYWLLNLNNISLDAIGIAGGHGNDIITNYGLLDVSAITTLTDEAGIAQTYSIGITGDKGKDQLVNEGQLNVTSDAVVNIDDVDFNLLETGDAQRQAMAIAQGITGNEGKDEITNQGQLVVTANATVDTTDVNVTLIGGAVDIDASSEAWAAAIGLDGGDGHDHIVNEGDTTIVANASVNSVDVGISLFSALQGESVRAPIDVDAYAMGMHGGDGHDYLENAGALNVGANANAEALSIDISAIDLSAGGMSTSSYASAVGIDGGAGKSEIYNSGDVTVESMAATNTNTVALTAVDFTLIPDIFILLTGNTAADISTSATADGTGIRTGNDHDWITNDGSLTVNVDAITRAVEVEVSVDGFSNNTDLDEFYDFFFGEPLIDASTTAEATSIGITSGHGHDDIYNHGVLSVSANADVTATDVGVDTPLPDLIPSVLPNIDTTEVETAASASAKGIVTGDGHDKVHNEGNVNTEATAAATSLNVAATLGIPNIEIDLPIPYSLEGNLVDVGAQSAADALGIITGSGHDYIYSVGDITAFANAWSSAENISGELTLPEFGSNIQGNAFDWISFELSLANASTEAEANATGISSGSGNDTLYTSGDIMANSFAGANSTTISVVVDLEQDSRLGIGASVTRASTDAQANSIGVELGEGNDTAHNEGSITARSHSNAFAFGLDGGITVRTEENIGIVGGLSWVTTNTIGAAFADGMLGGDGGDDIFNFGTIDVEAITNAHSVSVAVNVVAVKKGAAIGVALTEANTEGSTTSHGIRGGQDDDRLTNTGSINLEANTYVEAESIAVSLALADAGIALTGTAADASTHATSNAAGMTGDQADDNILNQGAVDVLANAEALAVSASVSMQYSNQSVAAGLALARATSEADAESQGISGGTDNDTINNSGSVTSHAISSASTGSVGLGGGISSSVLTIQGAAADASTTGTATATGISGESGIDNIYNEGDVDVLADTDATSVSVALTLSGTDAGAAFGVSLARAGTQATASATGISLGAEEEINKDGSDVIDGKSVHKDKGQDGNEENTEYLENDGSIIVESIANADSVAVSAQLGFSGALLSAGAALVDTSTTANATAEAIEGSQHRDVIINHNRIEADTFAEANTNSIGFSLNVSPESVTVSVAITDATATSEAVSTGIAGLGGDDDIINWDTIVANSEAETDAASVAVSFGISYVPLGVSIADTTTRADADAFGIDGGEGNDYLENFGIIDVDATSDAYGISVSAAPIGVALVGANITADSTAVGMQGAGGDDTIYQSETANLTATTVANATGTTVSAVLLGAAGSDDAIFEDNNSTALGDSIGLSGGAGSDKLHNLGSITTDAITTATGTSVDVSLVGAVFGENNTTATSRSTGIAGDAGDDYTQNVGSITAQGSATTNGTSVSVAQVGATFGDANSTATTYSTGIAGGTGDDYTENVGSIHTEADSDATGTSVSVALVGAAFANANTSAISHSTGMSGGAGSDYLGNVGSIYTVTHSQGAGSSVSVGLVGAALADASTSATSNSNSISGGLGDDYIENLDSVHALGEATANGTGVGVALVGAAFADASTTATVNSTGLSGDDGDDFIKNLGSVDAGGSSTASGISVSATLLGAAFSDANTTATTYSTGIAGGTGLDYIDNVGSINAYAYSDATGTSVSAGLVGASLADLFSVAESDATGIAAGADSDKVFNSGLISVNANANANGTSVSAQLLGYAEADASTRIDASAIGIDLGSGADRVLNEGQIRIAAESRSTLDSVSVSLIGEATAQADITANTDALGIAGGADDDLIVNTGSITVGPAAEGSPWMSLLIADTFTFNLIGVSDALSEIYADTKSIGLDGGAGKDYILNEGELDITASSYSSSSSSSYSIIGSASSSGAIITDATATGVIGGGNQGDEISNLALIDVLATSFAQANGDSFSLIGGASVDAFITAEANANGIIGSQGDDKLYNNGSINIVADSTAMAGQEGSVALVGGVASGADITANAIVRGMDASDGSDSIINEGDIDISAFASGDAESRSYTGVFEGDGDSDSHGFITAIGIGFELATGNNTLNNTGNLQVSASSLMDTYADADGANFVNGDAVSIADSIADSFVYGVWAGEGDNQIQNDGHITLTSEIDAIAYAHADSDEWLGTGVGTAYSYATNGEVSPLAVGIRLGDGNHRIDNDGLIVLDVTGTADSYAEGDSDAAWSAASADAEASMASSVYGIQVGDGNHKFYNSGDIIIEGSLHAFAHASANPTGDPDGRGDTDASTTTIVEGAGIATGNGHHEIVNTGNITVRLKANPDASIDNHDAYAHGDGDANTGTADTLVNATASSSGISSNADQSLILNLGNILVDSKANTAPYALAGSDHSGDAYAKSESTVNAMATGLVVMGNNNEIINMGDIRVLGQSNANSQVRATSPGPWYCGWCWEGHGQVDSDSHATAIAESSGIRSIGGADQIYNHGSIEVTSISDASMDSDAKAAWAGSWALSYATSIAEADAYGIRSDELSDNNTILDDFIINKGNILVSSTANAFADAYADDDGGRELASGTATAIANSFGIYTGNGNDTIINRGLIDVSAQVSASLVVDTEDEDREERYSSATAEAIGIYTGAGDDVIDHKGTIITSRLISGDPATGTAIGSGSGNDNVFLGESSSVTGNIELGENDDTLHIINTPVVDGRIFGGDGIDTAIYVGSGTFENPLEPDFENTVKKGEGTYKLSMLPPMQSITVEQGVLEINSDYEFAAGSTYMPSVSNGDGQGKLVINGAVNFSAASINVMKGRGHHMDGEKQTVLYASEGILNSMSFNNIKLPEKTPLLEFHHEITADEVQVSTSVESFKTVASTNNQRIIAHYMDGLLPNAEGNVSEALGEIQAMKAGGHGSAFSSVNPESYVNTQQALESSVKNYTSTVLQRTRGLRNIKQYNAFLQPGFLATEQGELLYKNQPADSLTKMLNLSSRAYRPYGAWVKSYWQDGQLDQTAANTGFDFDSNGYALGYDKWLDQERVIGISMGINETKLTADNNRTHSNIDSQLFSLYSSYVTDTGFIDGSISYGDNTYNTQRDATIGGISNTVFSEHDGDVYGASVVGGLFFLVNTWDLETYGALHYQQQDEDGFQESGTGGVSLSVAPRKSDLLSSEFGLRFGKQFKKRNSSMFTEFGIAWIHEYNDDSSVEASFVDSPNASFTVDAQDIDNDGALINLGLSYTNKKGLTGTAEYRTDIRAGYTDQTFFANIQYQFD